MYEDFKKISKTLGISAAAFVLFAALFIFSGYLYTCIYEKNVNRQTVIDLIENEKITTSKNLVEAKNEIARQIQKVDSDASDKIEEAEILLSKKDTKILNAAVNAFRDAETRIGRLEGAVLKKREIASVLHAEFERLQGLYAVQEKQPTTASIDDVHLVNMASLGEGPKSPPPPPPANSLNTLWSWLLGGAFLALSMSIGFIVVMYRRFKIITAMYQQEMLLRQLSNAELRELSALLHMTQSNGPARKRAG